MRVKDYEKVTTLQPNDILLIDGDRGVKSISPKTVHDTLIDGMSNDDFWKRINQWCSGSPSSWVIRRNLYRGKNLGSSYTEAQQAAVASGTFDDMFLGDYWTSPGGPHRIADMNYWLLKGDTPCNTNHLVIVPDNNLYSHVMNDTHTTEGAYLGSKMKKEGLANAKTIFQNAFGANKLLVHRELFTKTVANGIPTAGEWVDSDVDLMNEPMVYGSYMFAPSHNGTNIPYIYTIDNTQLALFRMRPSILNVSRSWFWLRDVVSATDFAYVNGLGGSDVIGAGYSGGVRPACGITG